MKLKYTLLIFIVLITSLSQAQFKISGIVSNSNNNLPIKDVTIYDKKSGIKTITNKDGYFEFWSTKEKITVVFMAYNFDVLEKKILLNKNIYLEASLLPISENLSEVNIKARKRKAFEMKRLKDVVGTAIYAGKKTEVVLVNQSMANLASNNARQIFSQVVGLNIYQNDDAGLQLNIGGRGLDPNRTANFNTRQNGYDISADVLGYPESYYTPASEALQEIQIIRGAASLQYGTQFGGLINFIIKKPNKHKPIELITRNTLGNNGLYTNFTSLSGTVKKWSYYTFFNYKKGNGFRPNSNFESKNSYGFLGYQFTENTKVSAELTHLTYLAQQAGGLTDRMFNQDHLQSNRSRNWFEVNWLLYSVKFAHKFTDNTNFTFNFFGLNADRKTIGFRQNRVDIPDLIDANGNYPVRDLITGSFNNYGLETRLLHKNTLFGNKSTYLIGMKYYKANNNNQQGPGSKGIDADFNFRFDNFPNYLNQSQHDNPNFNVAVFGENIFYLTDRISITPGFRYEYIKTESEGFHKKINLDGAGNVILNETILDDDLKERSFVLLGLGASYKSKKNLELYGNLSQNYRSVTFSDINIINPSFAIDQDITDEKGFTVDLGVRGKYKYVLSYDVGLFGLAYKDRIGLDLRVLENGMIKNVRDNIGDAIMYGVESLFDFNLNKLFIKNNDYIFSYFINTSIINSKYTNSEANGVVGNKVEFVPSLNLKTGIKFGYKNLSSNLQFTYLSSQFTDASNAVESDFSGVVGEIPAYKIVDLSLSYRYKKFKLETGINNLLDEKYFTRRASGYPGPGIIPSNNRNFYVTLEVKL